MAHPIPPPGSRIALVSEATWLFPQKVMDALANYFATGAVDPVVLQQLVQDAVTSAIGDRDVEIQATDTEIQYRASATDPWQTVITIAALQGPEQLLAYKHDQPAPSVDWVIAHPLSFMPSVTITDTAGTAQEGAVSYPDAHTVRIQFNAPFAGEALLS